jgi:GT2 family glycosyltransferase
LRNVSWNPRRGGGGAGGDTGKTRSASKYTPVVLLPAQGLVYSRPDELAPFRTPIDPVTSIVQSSPKPSVRAIAFVLPQFHPIPENDQWWGKGFTEWTNVTKAKANFASHEQPHEPADLGYYDLRVPETKAQQAELAARYGIHGFCYYYYWFAGKRLLYKPLEQILESGEPDFPFCMCWANESWSRAWDGRSGEVLIEQKHSDDDHRAFIQSLVPFFRDKRYIRVNGRPLLLIYRISIIPDIHKAVEIWRQECLLAGVQDPYLVAVQSYGLGDPTPYGFDAAVDFPPHGTDIHNNLNARYAERMLNRNFNGYIVDMRVPADMSMKRATPPYRSFRTVMPRWDNTARRQDNPLVFVNSTPMLYQRWLSHAVKDACRQFDGDERLVFINAWNEWAEGCHLEPDKLYGYAYLEATQRALVVGEQQAEQDLDELPPEVAAPQEAAAQPETLVQSAADAETAPEAEATTETAQAAAPAPAPAARNFVLRKLRGLYRRLPLPAALKIAVVHTAFEHAPWLFRNVPSYRIWLASRAVPGTPGSHATPVMASLAKPVVKNASAASVQEICFPDCPAPQVSVIIPVYGKIDYTLHCLRSIQESRTSVPFEIIVIDDCSKDNTAQMLALVRGIRVVRNETNLGFLHNCNKAAALARGNYLLFLNNDTQVHPGWMDALHDTFIEYPAAGLVGSKLIYPDARLQEAGGVIWEDASGLNYGRDGDAMQPEYCFLRDVDYCSGASIMVPRALFEQIGGFDKQLAPAYYEDTDLAFAVRREGYRVIFQPFSVVIHYEGITSGTDIKQGVKSYQAVNQHKMLAKWRDVLATHGTRAGDVWLARERTVKRRVLVMDWSTPQPDRDSGSIDTIQYMRMLQALGYKVVFCPHDLRHDGRHTEALQRIGVECLYQPYIGSLASHLDKYGAYYDLVLLQRAHYASEHIGVVRRKCARAKVIFNTVDLSYVREQRQAVAEQSAKLAAQAARTKALEVGVMRRSDATIVISEAEGELLRNELPELRVATIPYVREVQGSASSFGQRRDLVFIGGFGFGPNLDAMKYFADEIWPLIQQKLPDIRLMVVGSGMSPEVRRIGRIPGIEILGFVENITPIFNRCRLSIAPLRYGAGIKGKVGTSMSHGVPCVASPVAAEGMGLTHRVNVMIGDDAAAFAAAVVEAYQDEVLWDELSANGLRLFEQDYSFARGLERLRALLTDIGLSG